MSTPHLFVPWSSNMRSYQLLLAHLESACLGIVTSEVERVVHERRHTRLRRRHSHSRFRKYTGWKFYERQPAGIGA